MSASVVTFRFSFRTRRLKDVYIHWCLLDNENANPEFTDKIKLNHVDDSYDYSQDVTITVDRKSIIYFQFRYDNSVSRIGSYWITNSLQDPLLISELDRDAFPQEKFVTLRFKINYHTYYGQILYVVGSLPELGHWDNKKGLRLYHSNSPPSLDKQNGLFSDNKYNWQCDLRLPFYPSTISYRYVVLNESASPFLEPGSIRNLAFSRENLGNFIEFNDVWRWNELTQSLFSKRLFDEMLFITKCADLPIIGGLPPPHSVCCTFCAHCGVVGPGRKLYVVGSIPELGQWNPKGGAYLTPSADLQWSAKVIIPRTQFPFEFKFVAAGDHPIDSILWEIHENRVATISDISESRKMVTIDSWHINFANLSFHGAGVIINVDNLNVFDFGVLNHIIGWARETGFALIHISGLCDTTAMTNEFDSLPVSGFALNPLFINLENFGFQRKYKKYSELILDKLEFLKQYWNNNNFHFKTEVYKFKENNSWIIDYEKLCYARSIKKDFVNEVPTEFAEFVDFIQYLCYSQLTNAINYARSINLAIGTDITFAMSERGAEAFGQPELFLKDFYLGIPPSYNNPLGEKLPAYPYNFTNAEEWFRKRISHFSKLFSIIKLESTILYFRQWIIPRRTSVSAIFGHYEPSVNISYAELETWGLWDIDRYTQPYLRPQFLNDLFGTDAMKIRAVFLDERTSDGALGFKKQFSTEKGLVETPLSPEDDLLRKKYLKELLRLLGEVLLIKVGENEYRPRPLLQYAATEERNIPSFSFSQLPSYHQKPFLRLEEEFVNNKQRILWVFSGKQILQHITAINDATFFGDAAGFNGELCDETLQAVGVLPMRVQLEGRTLNNIFDDIRGYPYLSVATPQRNFSIPMRYIWVNSKEKAKYLWEEEFWETGNPPDNYSDQVASNIMKQHCWSGSMWVIFQIDSLIGAGKHIVPSEHSKFEALDIFGFISDQSAQHSISEILGQTQRK